VVKLSDRKIRWIVRHCYIDKDVSAREAARIYGVSVRRVQQLIKEYKETGEVPVLKKERRPRTYLSDEEKKIIEEVWRETRLGARLLYYELRKRGYKIPLNKIHSYYRETGKSKPNPKKQRKRKRCRYERKHSGSLLHGDWHRSDETKPYAIVWMDDASRKILAGGEYESATAEYSISTLQNAIVHASRYNIVIREVNTDRGSQFYANKGGKSQFQRYLESVGIKHVVSRKNNPQTNGKVERFWLEYDRHRWRFSSMDEFIEWYNRRIHGSLWLEIGENPNDAFIRKAPPESLLGLFLSLPPGGENHAFL
jgi:transposase InsO family protein